MILLPGKYPVMTVLDDVDSEAEHDYLARTIYGEARGEGLVAQILVAWVIRNRVEGPAWYGNSYQAVVTKPYQFSCWLENDPNYRKMFEARGDPWKTAQWVAALVMNAPDSYNPIPGVFHYVDTSISIPEWAKEMKQLRFDIAPKFVFFKKG